MNHHHCDAAGIIESGGKDILVCLLWRRIHITAMTLYSGTIRNLLYIFLSHLVFRVRMTLLVAVAKFVIMLIVALPMIVSTMTHRVTMMTTTRRTSSMPCPFLADIACDYVSLCRSLFLIPPSQASSIPSLSFRCRSRSLSSCSFPSPHFLRLLGREKENVYHMTATNRGK